MVTLRWTSCNQAVAQGIYIIDNCIVELAFAVIALLNLIPISIFLARILKRKDGLRQSMKVWMLLSICLLNVTICIAYSIDLNFWQPLKTDMYLLMRIVLNTATFVVVYFVYKKAARFANRDVHLKQIKYLFYVCLFLNLGFSVYMNRRAWNIVSANEPGTAEYQYLMCDTPLWCIDGAVELVQILIFLVAVVKLNQ